MKMTIAKKMAGIVAGVLIAALSLTLFLSQRNHERRFSENEKSSMLELNNLLSRSLMFSMQQGTTEVKPYIESMRTLPNLVDLRVTPTNLVNDGREATMDAVERSVLSGTSEWYGDEVFEGKDVVRLVTTINAGDNCIQCHKGNPGSPLAVVSVRYSFAENRAAMARERTLMILLSIVAIGIALGLVIFLVRIITKPIGVLQSIAEKITSGNLDVPIDVRSEDEIGLLASAFTDMRTTIKDELAHAKSLRNGLPSPLVIIDKNFLVQHVNLPACELFGYSKEDIQQKMTVKQLFGTDHITRATYDGKNAFNLSYTYHDRKGFDVPLLMSSGPMRNAEGEIVKVFITFFDLREEIKKQSVYLQQQIAPIAAAVSAVASGDLTRTAEVDSKSELYTLATEVNTMVGSIRGLLGKVSEAVSATASASNQISSSTEQMAAGSHQQTQQASEVAAAVEQMAKTIIVTTKNAGDAAGMARRAGESAREGGRIVVETMEGMTHIADVVKLAATTVQALGKSSDQIGDIVQVIDDIADQTNLLALNAAIEAARAGEQGRGFAVVADEVRKLAERTTKATKEIAVMIRQIQKNTSGAVESMNLGTVEVEKGRMLAERSSVSLKEIIDESEKVVEVVTGVAAASEEQSGASEMISRNIEAISSVTQESAAGTQQIAHAAEDLNRLTSNLQELLNQFRISGSGHHS